MPGENPKFQPYPPPWDGPVEPPVPPPPANPLPGLPDPGAFDPLKDPLPGGPGIPDILEWKLDVLINQQARQLWTQKLTNNILFWGFLALFAALVVNVTVNMFLLFTGVARLIRGRRRHRQH